MAQTGRYTFTGQDEAHLGRALAPVGLLRGARARGSVNDLERRANDCCPEYCQTHAVGHQGAPTITPKPGSTRT